MLDTMASQWKAFQRFAENLVFNEAPKFIRQLQSPESVPRTVQQGIQQGIKLGLEVLAGGPAESTPEITAGRPVSKHSVPTAHRARKLVYAPDLDGRADPGEIVWTWVVYEDDPTKGKDRPVLVVGRDQRTLLGLMLSNGLVALASALYCQYQGFADVNAGRGAIVIGLAAVIIGEVLFSRIFRNFALRLLGVSLGAVVYYLVIQVVLNLGLNTNDLKLISAFVVAIFLAVPYWKGKYFRGAAKSAAKTDAKEAK